MPFRFLRFYKVPLLLSITAGIAATALSVQRDPLQILLLFIGALLGTFVLELDYVLHAFFIEPENPSSNLVKDYVHHRDLYGLAGYIQSHKEDFRNKTLHSAFFQIILAAMTIFVLSSNAIILIKMLILSAFVNSVYRLVEDFLHNQAPDWFWSLKINTSQQSVYLYIGAMILALFYCFYIF